MASKNYASKTKTVTCGYCNLLLLKQNLSAHNNLKHPGQPEFIAGDSEITGYFNTQSKKREKLDPELENKKISIFGFQPGMRNPDFPAPVFQTFCVGPLVKGGRSISDSEFEKP